VRSERRIGRPSRTPSSLHWFNPERTLGEILYSAILRRAVGCPDLYVQLRGHWIGRRLSPHCSRIELDALVNCRGQFRLLGAMGRETAKIHLLWTEEKRKAILKDFRKRKRTGLLGAAQATAAAMEKEL
jgi:hypothetical protein